MQRDRTDFGYSFSDPSADRTAEILRAYEGEWFATFSPSVFDLNPELVGYWRFVRLDGREYTSWAEAEAEAELYVRTGTMPAYHLVPEPVSTHGVE